MSDASRMLSSTYMSQPHSCQDVVEQTEMENKLKDFIVKVVCLTDKIAAGPKPYILKFSSWFRHHMHCLLQFECENLVGFQSHESENRFNES